MPSELAADFVVVGSGIAGLRAAIALGEAGRTLVLTKEAVAESATAYAQGGIAAATGDDDTVALHESDTLAAGDGLCSPAAVRLLVREGPHAIEELLAWGAEFDRTPSGLARTREAAHSRSRILHAHGDSTGREIAATLARRAAAMANIEFVPHGRVTALLRDPNHRVAGVACQDPGLTVRARAVLLATGGVGQLYSETTNPSVATGDGPALAWVAGADLADLEFIQFHPTALALPHAPRFLLSEALRGEGAVLRNPAGERFLPACHPAAELAPRDVVARAIAFELSAAPAGATCFLDATALPAAHLAARFPRIAATLAQFGLNLSRAWIPIRPAAHYAMGGIATSLEGRASVPGLFAAGECAATGVHGANRLASNSLLEGLIFGARAALAMRDEAAPAAALLPAPPSQASAPTELVQHLMSRCAGIVRSGDALRQGLEELVSLGAECGPAATAAAIVRAALAREESRGAHFRSDFPDHNPALAGLHSMQSRGQPVRFVLLNPDR
ncbi:MAG TPA: L-aspartate oxidase [Terriglobales bacterium]|nr:L-aspartate oxidase [Terriglobales bacterium]